jgi:hypothetical protein
MDKTALLAIVSAMSGLIGGIIGVWLNSVVTTRRERWNLKRDLYTRLRDVSDHSVFIDNKYPICRVDERLVP